MLAEDNEGDADKKDKKQHRIVAAGGGRHVVTDVVYKPIVERADRPALALILM